MAKKIMETIGRAARRAGNKTKAALGSPSAQRLTMWQERLSSALQAAQPVLSQMDYREKLYAGTMEIESNTSKGRRGSAKEASHNYNFCSELIESMVDNTIPTPRVDAVFPEDAALARIIELMLTNEAKRLKTEEINDEQERTCYIQGGVWTSVEWDNTIRTHDTTGDVSIHALHPKQVLVQPGVHQVPKASWIICQYAVTKDSVKRRFGVDVGGESEERPEVNYAFVDKNTTDRDENVTLNMAFYINKRGEVGVYGWVNDVQVIDNPDFLARRMEVCEKCDLEKSDEVCACGSKKFKSVVRKEETLAEDVVRSDGVVIPAGTKIRYYRPRTLPIVLRKNISSFGKLLGESDVDKIKPQILRAMMLETKVTEKMLKGGSVITLPRDLQFDKGDSEMRIIRVSSSEQANGIKAITLQPNTSYDIAEVERCRQAAKNILGITDSYQGLPDKTAASGIAKQIAANQSAGRMESKRRMKSASWEDIYRLIFMFKLAFADEPRPYAARAFTGAQEYGQFNRYDFLKQDAAGEWFYEDRFLFSVDDSGAIANNRAAMWQENRANYQNGSFGPVNTPESRVLFWQLMDRHHYPDAAEVRRIAEEQYQNEMRLREMEAQVQMMMAQQQQVQQAAQQQAAAPPRRVGLDRTGGIPDAAPVAQQAREV